MLCSYEFRMYPNDSQKELLAKHFGHCRWFYNYALNKRIETYKTTNKTISRYELSSDLPKLKLNEQTKWLSEVNSQSLQATLIHLDSAYKKFFTRSGGFPKFKNKNSKQSFEIPKNLNVNFESGFITIPKFKEPIRTIFHRNFIGEIRTCHIKKSNTGKYFVSILVEDGKESPIKLKVTIENSIGIDVGIKSFLVTSDGEEVNNPKFLAKSEKKLKRIQQSFSRKVKGSNNYNKQKLELQLLHEHVANQRKDWLHKLTTRLISENQTICIESLAVKEMMMDKKKDENYAKAIGDVGWGTFFNQLKYKGEWYGNNILAIGRYEPSSKLCSNCGYIKHDLNINDRNWICPKCNVNHDRDYNASVNIKAIALKDYNNNTGSSRNTQKFKPVMEPKGTNTGRLIVRSIEAKKYLASG